MKVSEMISILERSFHLKDIKEAKDVNELRKFLEFMTIPVFLGVKSQDGNYDEFSLSEIKIEKDDKENSIVLLEVGHRPIPNFILYNHLRDINPDYDIRIDIDKEIKSVILDPNMILIK